MKREPTQQAPERLNGVIARIVADRGFAFIRSGETDYFMHHTSYRGGDFLALKEKMAVTFEGNLNAEKGPRAENVERAK